MAGHLEPGGVLMVERWVEPEHWRGTSYNAISATSGDAGVARVSRSVYVGIADR